MIELPESVIECIVDCLPPSLNVCLVSKKFRRSRKPLTVINRSSIALLGNDWWLQELSLPNIDNHNVFEYLMWICASHGANYNDLFEKGYHSVFANDNDVKERLRCYKKIRGNGRIYCNLGNVAMYLFQQCMNSHHGTDLEGVCIDKRNMFMATWYFQECRKRHLTVDDNEYCDFIRYANLEMLKWFHKYQFYSDAFLMYTLIEEDKLDEFRYFQNELHFVVNNDVLEYIDKCNSIKIREYIIQLH